MSDTKSFHLLSTWINLLALNQKDSGINTERKNVLLINIYIDIIKFCLDHFTPFTLICLIKTIERVNQQTANKKDKNCLASQFEFSLVTDKVTHTQVKQCGSKKIPVKTKFTEVKSCFNSNQSKIID